MPPFLVFLHLYDVRLQRNEFLIFGAPYTYMIKESAAAKNRGALFAEHVVCADCRRYGVLTPADNIQKRWRHLSLPA